MTSLAIFAACVVALVGAVTLPQLPLEGAYFAVKGTPALAAEAQFGYSTREQWSSRARYKELRTSLSGVLDITTYTDLCLLFDRSLVTAGVAIGSTCFATSA
jgi:hypothetical protein